MVTEEQYLVATEPIEDMAALWVEAYLEGLGRAVDTGMRFSELRRYITTRNIQPGETYRRYLWNGEEITESLIMHQVCCRLELYPPEGLDQLDEYPV